MCNHLYFQQLPLTALTSGCGKTCCMLGGPFREVNPECVALALRYNTNIQLGTGLPCPRLYDMIEKLKFFSCQNTTMSNMHITTPLVHWQKAINIMRSATLK